MMKRWWVLAVLVTLALSLTSCSKPMPQASGQNYGCQSCHGSMGSFDVYVIPSAADPTLFQISVIPYGLDAPGDIAEINLANESLAYQTLVSQIVLNEDQEINAGTVTQNDLDTFTLLAITSFDPSTNFLESNSDKDAMCTLPAPGDDECGN